MVLECLADILKLCKCLRELLLHLCDRHRSADTCHNVLALRIDQELAHQLPLTGRRISRKRNAGAAVIAHVSECHALYVYRCSPGIRDIVVAAVHIRTRVVPGTEDSLDSAHQLLLRVIREVRPDLLFVFSLELACKLF